MYLLDLQFCKANWLILTYIVWEIAYPFGGMFGFIGANVGFVEVINGDSFVIFLYFIDIRWLDLQSYL